MEKVVHLLSVHSKCNIRIFIKNSRSIVFQNDIFSIIVNKLSDEINNKVNINLEERYECRSSPTTRTLKKVYKKTYPDYSLWCKLYAK